MAAEGAKRVRALIVDDEELGRRRLRTLLAADTEVEVIGEAESASEARQKIGQQRPDLVFMDVEMPGGSGIELLQNIGDPHPYVIFVTAHPEFALSAFELQAGDYLMKPVHRQRFQGSVLRAKNYIAERRIAELARKFADTTVSLVGRQDTEQTPAHTTYPSQMMIRIRRRLFAIEVGDIAWIQGASQYSRVHTSNDNYLVARTLASLECELDPKRFFRIHRSAIVNVTYVREVRTSGEGRYFIHLHGGQALPLGRARREILNKLLVKIGDSDD